MSIESKIDKRLWNAIHKSYDDCSYTTAILDGVQFLGDLIREKTGLESDGISLAGAAFAGANPKLKVNKLQTESETSEQGGIEHLVRGVYKAIRNPRSHEKFNDSQDKADSILLFINYLIQVIDQSKSQFDKKEFLNRVFDKHFAEEMRYANLLVDEVPPKYQFDLLVEIYRQRENGNANKLSWTVRAFWERLTDQQKDEFAKIVSADLNTLEQTNLVNTIKVLPEKCWPLCSQASRIRIENQLINSIEEGTYSVKQQRCVDGAVGTWITRLPLPLLMTQRFENAVASRLRSEDTRAIEYIFKYIFSYLVMAVDKPGFALQAALNAGLKRGDKRFASGLSFITADMRELLGDDWFSKEWVSMFETSLTEFKEVVTVDNEEGVPF